MDFTDMTGEELAELQENAGRVLSQRQTAQVFEHQVEEVYLSARESGAVPTPVPGDQWREPGSALEAYVRGDVTTDNGKYFVSLRTPNMKRPSTSGGMMTMSASSTSSGAEWWQEVDPDDLPTKEPEQAEDQYADVPDYEAPAEGATHKTGDLVRFKGAIYEATRDTQWSPSYDPDAWEFVESGV